MAYCSRCGALVPDNAAFCGKCGTRIILEKNGQTCQKCGTKIEGEALFCPKCGTKVSGSSTQKIESYAARPNVNAAPPMEQELYHKKMIGYYTGLTQISGDLLVTNKKIVYTPLAMYVLHKAFTIDMNQVLTAARASVLGIDLCIRVTTTGGKSHTFALGIQNSSDIQRVVDIINNAKQAVR